MVYMKVDPNFYSIDGSCEPEIESPKYKKYRKEWMENPILNKAGIFPLHLDIESTNLCNLKCRICDKKVISRDKKERRKIPLASYKSIIDEGAEHSLYSVKLSYRGEPLMHEQLPEMVEYAKRKNIIDVYFNTNGLLLDGDIITKLIDAGLDRISISIDGTSKAEYEKIRVGSNLHKIFKNIDNLIDSREKKGVYYPRIRIQSVRLGSFNTDLYKSFIGKRYDELALIDYKSPDFSEDMEVVNWACPQIWQRMTITCEGHILPCNNDDKMMFKLGSIGRDSLVKCWNSEKMNYLRLCHKRGESHKSISCRICPWKKTQLGKLKNRVNNQ